MSLRIVPTSLKAAQKFVELHHRHNDPPRGHKFSIAIAEADGDQVVGVAMVGRPVAKALDDGFTLEINRTCTDGARNANSMLYGAAARAAKALGYLTVITYTQADESGASLRGAGFVKAKTLKARSGWEKRKDREQVALPGLARDSGGVDRVRWEIHFRG